MTTEEPISESRSPIAAPVFPVEAVPPEHPNPSAPPDAQVKPEEDVPMQISTAPLPSLQESNQNGGVATGFEAPTSIPMPRFSVSNHQTHIDSNHLMSNSAAGEEHSLLTHAKCIWRSKSPDVQFLG